MNYRYHGVEWGSDLRGGVRLDSGVRISHQFGSQSIPLHTWHFYNNNGECDHFINTIYSGLAITRTCEHSSYPFNSNHFLKRVLQIASKMTVGNLMTHLKLSRFSLICQTMTVNVKADFPVFFKQ